MDTRSFAVWAYRFRFTPKLRRLFFLLPFVFTAATITHAQAATPSFVTPSSGSGSAQLFSATFSDPNGASDIAIGTLDIMSNVVPGTPAWSAHECILRYDLATNAIWLVPDGGGVWSGPITAGSAATLSNSQCSVLASGSSAQLSGTTAQVNFLVTFTAAFAGAKQLYMVSQDIRGSWSSAVSQQQFGGYTVTATSSPLKLVPSTNSGTRQVFTATYYNPNGGLQIKEADLNIMSNVVPGSMPGWSANECMFQYDVASNNVWQVPDAGGVWAGPTAAGGNGYLSNSQCSIFAAGSGAQISGNTVTVSFAIEFIGTNFIGAKQMYMVTQDTLGHWSTNSQQQFGTWIIPGGQADGPVSIPNSFTAAAPVLTCDNISGQWKAEDAFGNAIGWNLNQTGNSVSGTLVFDDYLYFSFGRFYCGTITYTATGQLSNGSFSLTASQPMPPVDNCGNPLAPMETETVTLSGGACGNGSSTFNFTPVSTQSTLRAMPGSAMSMAAQAAQNSGSSTWTTLTPRFTVQHASYIPVDNIHGPSFCGWISLPGDPVPIFKLYKGDALRGTFRTRQSIFVVPDTGFSNNFVADAGPSRNYGSGSPLNGSVLSSTPATADIYNGPYTGADEDSIQGDCMLWNDRGKADLSTMQGYSVSYPSGKQAQVNLSGLGRDPLELQLGGIKWNATVTIDDSNPSQPTASVNITHTCYPAHIVQVNGATVYSYQPSANNTLYLFSCLTFRSQITATSSAPVPNH